MRQMICTECDLNPDKYVCYHAFNLPNVSEPGFYRSVGSFNAFFNSGKKGRHWTKHKLYHQMDDISLGWHKKCYINLETIEHKDIWEFYKYIGYDYKRKKYME
jgi:hypothetical protein